MCYQVTDPSGNKSVKVCRTIEVKESTDGITDAGQKAEFRVYPNPNNGTFSIDISFGLNEMTSIELYDVTGKSVYKTHSWGGTTRLNLDNLPAGIYQLRIQQSNKYSVSKVNIIR